MKKKRIDKVTTDRLMYVLKCSNIELPMETVDKIIDAVELIEDNGGKTSLNDIEKMNNEWKKYWG